MWEIAVKILETSLVVGVSLGVFTLILAWIDDYEPCDGGLIGVLFAISFFLVAIPIFIFIVYGIVKIIILIWK